MKKSFKFYAIIWAILFVLYCAVVFLVRPAISGLGVQNNAQFWLAFILTVAAFVGNLVCARLAFKADNLKKMFLNLPLITVSWSALIAMLIAGSILMLIPKDFAFIAAVICVVILAFNAIAVVKASWAAEAVNSIDEKVKTQTSFIRNLTVEADSLLARAKSDAVKTECKKVYEAIRYSDPMSNEALSQVEMEIKEKVCGFSVAISADDLEKAKVLAEEITALISERNAKCKAWK